VRDYRDTQRANAERQTLFNCVLRAEGILKPPMKFYPCLAHDAADLAHTKCAISAAMQAVAEV